MLFIKSRAKLILKVAVDIGNNCTLEKQFHTHNRPELFVQSECCCSSIFLPFSKFRTDIIKKYSSKYKKLKIMNQYMFNNEPAYCGDTNSITRDGKQFQPNG